MATSVRELRNKPDEELREDLANHREELFNLEFQSATEQIDNPARIRQLRRDVARVLTVLRERELGIRGAASKAKK
jgi:large subunit ribosomal protein L29